MSTPGSGRPDLARPLERTMSPPGRRVRGARWGCGETRASSGSPSGRRSGSSRARRRSRLEQWAGLAADCARRRRHRRRRRRRRRVRRRRRAKSSMFLPATVAEYCGWSVNFAERVDLGGRPPSAWCGGRRPPSSSGSCDVVVCATPAGRRRRRRRACRRTLVGVSAASSSMEWGSPQAEFDVPVRQRGAELRLRDVRPALPRPLRLGRAGRAPRSPPTSASNACANPAAVFYGQPDHDRRRAGVARWSPPRCTCSRSSCRAPAAPRSW